MGIIEIFKKIIEVKNDDLSFLNVGDIIWAKRYKNDEEKNKLGIGHQESPFVIIKKKKSLWLTVHKQSTSRSKLENVVLSFRKTKL